MTNELKLLENFIKTRTNKVGDFPDIIHKGLNTISRDIPFKLKLAIVLSELITFSSHLRKSIILYDGTLVPTNAITFALSGSGDGKDKAMNSVRRSLETAYNDLENSRKEYAKETAENTAIIEGDVKENWQKYYLAPKPLQAGLGTSEGLLHHFASLGDNLLGAGSIMSNEIGTELQTNGAITDIIKTIAVMYDLGNIDPKILKSNDNQTGSIRGLPVNALLFGTQKAILFDANIKAKFKLLFNTQLARRSIFSFTPEKVERIKISKIEDINRIRREEREKILNAQQNLNSLTANLTRLTNQDPLPLSDEAYELFDVYMEYNSILSDNLSSKYPISKISRKHKQWLALKLSGSYAILDGCEDISLEHYCYAINTVEFLSNDLIEFEKELIKEPYEQFVDYCKNEAEDGEFEVSLHELRKLGYISGTGASKNKINELTDLANSCDSNAIYTPEADKITYKQRIEANSEVGVSYIIF